MHHQQGYTSCLILREVTTNCTFMIHFKLNQGTATGNDTIHFPIICIVHCWGLNLSCNPQTRHSCLMNFLKLQREYVKDSTQAISPLTLKVDCILSVSPSVVRLFHSCFMKKMVDALKIMIVCLFVCFLKLQVLPFKKHMYHASSIAMGFACDLEKQMHYITQHG